MAEAWDHSKEQLLERFSKAADRAQLCVARSKFRGLGDLQGKALLGKIETIFESDSVCLSML